jgi:hypothetical protein
VSDSDRTCETFTPDDFGSGFVGSIQRRLNAVAEALKATGLDSPNTAGMVRNTLKGIRRALGTPTAPKEPTLTDGIRAMSAFV